MSEFDANHETIAERQWPGRKSPSVREGLQAGRGRSVGGPKTREILNVQVYTGVGVVDAKEAEAWESLARTAAACVEARCCCRNVVAVLGMLVNDTEWRAADHLFQCRGGWGSHAVCLSVFGFTRCMRLWGTRQYRFVVEGYTRGVSLDPSGTTDDSGRRQAAVGNVGLFIRRWGVGGWG